MKPKSIPCADVDNYLARFRPTEGRALIVGSNTHGIKSPRQKLYPDAIGMDAIDGHNVDLVHDFEEPLDETFSHIDCCSVMEHCQRPWLMATNMENALESGGTILISVPFAWRLHDYPGDYWRLTASALDILFPSIQWIDKKYLSNGFLWERPQSLLSEDKVGFERTEVVAFGIKKN